MDSTLGLVDSTLGLVDSTLGLVDSTLGLGSEIPCLVLSFGTSFSFHCRI